MAMHSGEVVSSVGYIILSPTKKNAIYSFISLTNFLVLKKNLFGIHRGLQNN